MNRPLDRDRPSSSQVWLDVVSAVDYLTRGHRPGMTVYDAVEEALRWHAAARVAGYNEQLAIGDAGELPWHDPDPLRSALENLVLDHPPALDEELVIGDAVHQALLVWTIRMADRYNDGRRWTHPMSSGGAVSPVALAE